MQEELGRIQEEQGRLPALVAEVAEALEAEAAAFARQEAGGLRLPCYSHARVGCIPCAPAELC